MKWEKLALWQKAGIIIAAGIMLIFIFCLFFGGEEENDKKDKAPASASKDKRPPRHLSGVFQVWPGETKDVDIGGKPVRGRVGERFVGRVLEGELGHLYFVNDHLPPLKIKKKYFRLKIISTAGDNKFRLINTSKGADKETKYLVSVQVSL